MKRRLFVGGAFAGIGISNPGAAQQSAKAGDIPITTLGKTGMKVSVIAQGGAVNGSASRHANGDGAF